MFDPLFFNSKDVSTIYVVGVGNIVGGNRGALNKAIAGYLIHLVSTWDQHGLMQFPGNYGGLDAALGENLFLSFLRGQVPG